MAGHSKWAQIKHKKAVTDARRGAEFTKLARAIQVAARDGGDPAGNASLANAIQKAKDAGMPKQNIERAIAKGTGADTDADAIETVVYEGYGPGGVAVMVEALTDNRNRTGSEVRHIFSKSGGSLGEPGSVAWQFEKKGVIVVDAARASEDDLMVAIDAGAEDVAIDENVYEVVTAPADLQSAREALEAAGIAIESAELTMRPTSRVEVDEGQVRSLMRLLEELEEHDDVNAVHANFDVDASVLERVAAACGRATSVLALAPAGLWQRSPREADIRLNLAHAAARFSGPLGPAVVRTAWGRRLALRDQVGRPAAVRAEWAIAGAEDAVRAAGWRAHFRAIRGQRFTGGSRIDVPITVVFGDP